VVVAIVLAVPAACLGADRTEQRVASAAPDAKLVTESYVRIRAPLPASAGAHPEACDWVSYLRFRNADGPRDASVAFDCYWRGRPVDGVTFGGWKSAAHQADAPNGQHVPLLREGRLGPGARRLLAPFEPRPGGAGGHHGARARQPSRAGTLPDTCLQARLSAQPPRGPRHLPRDSGSPRLFGIRRGRVRYIAVANRRLLRKPAALRRALRRAGLR